MYHVPSLIKPYDEDKTLQCASHRQASKCAGMWGSLNAGRSECGLVRVDTSRVMRQGKAGSKAPFHGRPCPLKDETAVYVVQCRQKNDGRRPQGVTIG